MHPVLIGIVISGMLPSPSQVMLRTPTATELTRRLLAQDADRDAEIEALEQDMERSRRRFKPSEAERESLPSDAGEVDPTPRPLPPGVTRPPGRYVALKDGNSKTYYLVWGIVDWVLAGQLWGASLYTGAYALIVSAASRSAGFSDESMANVALFMGGISLALGAVGGIAAWRGGYNIGSYRELKTEERSQRPFVR